MAATASILTSLYDALTARKPQPKRNRVSPEGRRKLSETALKHRPWTHSTGPRTAEGKAKSAANGLKRQKVPGPSVRQLRRELAEATTMVAQMTEMRKQIDD